MRWAWEGIFAMDVPEAWEVREQNDLIEVVPPDPVGAAHISILRRTGEGEVSEGEAALLASDFARKQGVPHAAATETRQHGQWSARINFQTADDRGPFYWHVETRVWNGRALVCSYTHDGQHANTKTAALKMFASIQPL